MYLFINRTFLKLGAIRKSKAKARTSRPAPGGGDRRGGALCVFSFLSQVPTHFYEAGIMSWTRFHVSAAFLSILPAFPPLSKCFSETGFPFSLLAVRGTECKARCIGSMGPPLSHTHTPIPSLPFLLPGLILLSLPLSLSLCLCFSRAEVWSQPRVPASLYFFYFEARSC